MSRSAGELWIIKAITLGDVRTLLVQIIIWRLFVNASGHRFVMIHLYMIVIVISGKIMISGNIFSFFRLELYVYMKKTINRALLSRIESSNM